MTSQPDPDLPAMRREYARSGLAEADLAGSWLEQFHRWLGDAVAAGLPEPNAMVLGTVGEAGRPSARTVLLKGVDERGFVFFTNLASRKATELSAHPYVSVVFPWHPIGRQVVIEGQTEQIDRADTEAYFATRPRDSRLGAWASPQSRVVANRAVLDEALAAAADRFGADGPTHAPANWGGIRIVPYAVEFWQGREGRLHDRLRFRPTLANGGWTVERLAP